MYQKDSIELMERGETSDSTREFPKPKPRPRNRMFKPGSTSASILNGAKEKLNPRNSESTENLELEGSVSKHRRPQKSHGDRSGIDNLSYSEYSDEEESKGQRRGHGSSTKRRQETRLTFLTDDDDSHTQTTKEDYLTIAIPEDEGQNQDLTGAEIKGQDSTSSSTSFLGRWKRSAQNFLKMPARSISLDEEASAGIKTPETPVDPSPVVMVTDSKERLKLSKEKVKLSKEELKKQKKAELIEMKKPIEIPPTPTKKFKSKKAGVTASEPIPKSPDPSASSLTSLRKRDQRRSEMEGSLQRLFGITIHNSDYLPSDHNILHPLVRVSIMNEDGTFLLQDGLNSGQSLEVTGGRSDGDNITDKKRRRYNRKGELEPESREKKPPRRSRTKSDDSVVLKRASLLPVMTQPFEGGQRLMSLAPTWNELILFEEPFNRFVQPESGIIIFFEILDFLPMNLNAFKSGRGYHGSEPGWYHIAWAFLKPVGANGIRNVNRKVRLQLFAPEALPKSKLLPGPEVYSWWMVGKRIKLQSTLYVTLRGVLPPASINTASIRTLLTMRKEDLTQAILDGQVAQKKKRRKASFPLSEKPSLTDLHIPQWSRLQGQSCKVPNKLTLSLPSSQISSLNLVVSGNVHCVKFSPCGLFLAAGLDTEELHTVLVFEIPSGRLLVNLRGHHGLIYDLAWQSISEANNQAPLYCLASASADSTVLVWLLQGTAATPHLLKTLLHPSFVYCVQFHPTKKQLIATGCFDNIIRIWNVSANTTPAHKKAKELLPQHENQSSPVALLDRHYIFVNCITFNLDGKLLFSGDGEGSVVKWHCSGKLNDRGERNWTVQKDTRVNETGKSAINNLVLHPNGTKLLVHVRDSCLKILDIDTLLVLHSFSGLANEKLQVRSCFSPCGNLVLSGSEDSTLCVWDADTSRILQFITPDKHPNCIVTSVDYHPFEHMVVAGLSSSISEPSPILIYTYTPSDVALAAVAKLKTRIAKLRKPVNVETTSSSVMTVRDAVLESMPSTDSTTKFRSIIKKLDEVKFVQGLADRSVPMTMSEVTKELMRRQPNKEHRRESAPEPKPETPVMTTYDRRRHKSDEPTEIDPRPIEPKRPSSANIVRPVRRYTKQRPRSATGGSKGTRSFNVEPERPLSGSSQGKGRANRSTPEVLEDEQSPENRHGSPIPSQRHLKSLAKSTSEDSSVRSPTKRRKSPKRSSFTRQKTSIQDEAPETARISSETSVGNTKRRERRERMMRNNNES